MAQLHVWQTGFLIHPRVLRLVLSCILLLSASLSYSQPHSQSGGRSLPLQGIDENNLAVIVNSADPLSLAVGHYYAEHRHIPPTQVIQVALPVGVSVLSPEEFVRIKAEVDAVTPSHVQAYALTWAAPYRVGCMSITAAFAFGFDASYCADGCHLTRLSPYFNSNSRFPASELRMRPTMMLAGRDFPQIKALIDRGIRSDGTYPRGTAYLLTTRDAARSTRSRLYDSVSTVAAGLIGIETLQQDELRDRTDVLFYFTGATWVNQLGTLRFLPGAIADHLTSFGGQLTDSSQMSALRWLEAGATGSYGTVVEPCNFVQKFPHPGVVVGRYVRGETLIEAYWKSVACPGQGVFVGEPLAAPFRYRRRESE